ncbi:putative T7SS-secreted protein [Streptomyces sp. NPDC057253]|uniref:scabin-related ADP-ribosyltransferase n=1 Tax=Streptomyces sp. NPDC057253 TaxID=3346069 RepID=UPI003628037F
MSGSIPAGATVTDLVPGAPEELDDLAAKLSQYGKAFDESARRLRGLDTSGWSGDAAEGFRTTVGRLPDGLEKARDAFSAACRAVDTYADALRRAQKEASAVIEDAAEARLASRKHAYAVEDYEQARAVGDSTAIEPPGADPGAAAMSAASARLAQARARVEEAADRAARTLRDAAEAAPDEPRVLDRFMGWGKSFADGFGEAGLDLLTMGVKTDPFYALVNPAGFLKQTTTTLDGLVWGAQNPKEFVKAATDWETWRSDPARALGHLGPDAVVELLTGGVGGLATKASTAARRSTHALEEGAEAAQHAAGAARHLDDAVAAARRLDPDDPRSLPAAADRNVDVDGIRNPAWRTDHEPLWRNDDRHPSEIFEDGFHPRDTSNTDLHGYVEGNHPSAFVGTTRDADANWLKNYRYEIDAPGGVDVNRTLPNNKYAETDQEIAFPGGIDRRHIKGAWEIHPDGSKGEWMANPHYEPPRPKPPPASSLPPGWTR